MMPFWDFFSCFSLRFSFSVFSGFFFWVFWVSLDLDISVLLIMWLTLPMDGFNVNTAKQYHFLPLNSKQKMNPIHLVYIRPWRQGNVVLFHSSLSPRSYTKVAFWIENIRQLLKNYTPKIKEAQNCWLTKTCCGKITKVCVKITNSKELKTPLFWYNWTPWTFPGSALTTPTLCHWTFN